MRKHLFYILLALLIAANQFYDYRLFENEQLVKLSYYAIFILFAFGIVQSYFHERNQGYRIRQSGKEKSISFMIKILFVVVIISIFNAYIYKDQPLSTGIMTTAQTLTAYLLFFLLKSWGLKSKDFECIIVIMGMTYIVVLIIAYVTMPNPLFGNYGIEEGRGGSVRFRIPGYFWTAALFFLSISRFKTTNNSKWLLVMGICFAGTVLTFARQYLAYSIILGSLYYFSAISMFRKVAFVIIALLFLHFVLPQIKLFNAYVELTQEQIDRNKNEEDDVRINDYRVFLFDYPRSTQQYLFGCGMGSYGNSKYGNELERMVINEHLVQEDTGWAGFVFYYGYVGVVILIILLVKALTLKCLSRFLYIKYVIVYMSLCAIMGGSILYFHEYMIIIMCIYMLTDRNDVRIPKI